MTAVDTNILIYAHRTDLEFHARAKAKILTLAENGTSRWAIPWPCIHEFLSVTTNPRTFENPSSVQKATEQIEIWMESPSLLLISETSQYWYHLRQNLDADFIRGPRIHDARIAAICSLHGVKELWSADRDFNRFPNLKVINPLVG